MAEIDDLAALDPESFDRELRAYADSLHVGIDDPRVSSSVFGMSLYLRAHGNLAKAEELGQRALALRQRWLVHARDAERGEAWLAVAASQATIGSVLFELGRVAEAEPLLRAALPIYDADDQAYRDESLAICAKLAGVYLLLGRFADADEPSRRAIAGYLESAPPGAPDTVILATAMADRGAVLMSLGRVDEAEPLLTRSQAAFERPDADPRLLPYCLTFLGGVHVVQVKVVDAERELVRAVELFARGAPTVWVVMARQLLARLYLDVGRLVEAEAIARAALDEPATHAIPGLIAVVRVLLASVLAQRGNAGGARPLAEAAVAELEALPSGAAPQLAEALRLLSGLYLGMGEPLRALDAAARAAGLLEHAPPALRGVAALALALALAGCGRLREASETVARACAMVEAVLGPGHPRLAECLGTRAAIDVALGHFDEADANAARSLAIIEARLGPASPSLGVALVATIAAYRSRGAYDRAFPLARRNLALAVARAVAESADAALAWDQLAILQVLSGDNDEALYASDRALAIWETAHDELQIAGTLQHQALAHDALGNADRASELAARSLALIEAHVAADDERLGRALNNLALVRNAAGAYDEACALLERGRVIAEHTLGPAHPSIGISLFNIASLQRTLGELDAAAASAARGIAIIERALGPDHPDLEAGLRTQAAIADRLGEPEHALALYRRAFAIEELHLAALLRWGSEPRKLAAIAGVADSTSRAVSFHVHAMPASPDAFAFAATTVLQRKGRVLDTRVDELAALHRHATPETRALADALAVKRGELAALVLGAPPASAADELRALRRAIDELEIELSDASAVYASRLAPISIEAVQAALPAHSVALEIVRYRPYAPGNAPSTRWGADRYVAYWLTRATAGWVDFGDAGELDLAITAALDVLARDGLRDALRALDQRILAPIRRAVGAFAHLFVSPDGGLNLFPFEAMIDEAGQYLIETACVTYVTGVRDVIVADPIERGGPPLVVAAPAYGAGARFQPLEGTVAEGRDFVARYPDAVLLGGELATKSKIRTAARSARLVHVATHGFFAAPGLAPPVLYTRDLAPGYGELRALPRNRGDALDVAGLAVAGANLDAAGILSARELLDFDLWGTELVVLSACDTGIGDLTPGEGVVGFRRAAVMAGAQTTVVSLWKVSDDATRELMALYYAQLDAGAGRSEALMRAKRQMIATPALAQPALWAAFVSAGDWRPLRRR